MSNASRAAIVSIREMERENRRLRLLHKAQAETISVYRDKMASAGLELHRRDQHIEHLYKELNKAWDLRALPVCPGPVRFASESHHTAYQTTSQTFEAAYIHFNMPYLKVASMDGFVGLIKTSAPARNKFLDMTAEHFRKDISRQLDEQFPLDQNDPRADR